MLSRSLRPAGAALLFFAACSSSDDSSSGNPSSDGGGATGTGGAAVAGNGGGGASVTGGSGGGIAAGNGGGGASNTGGTVPGDAGPDASLPPIPTGPPTPVPTACVPDPAEEQNGGGIRVKSPAPQMRFTAGLPFRILADYSDPNAWQCPPGHPPYVCPGTEMRFYVDDVLVGSVPPSPAEEDHFELRLSSGLPQGDHDLRVSYVRYDPQTNGAGAVVDGPVHVKISVDPRAAHSGTVTLDADLVLSGNTDLDWTDKTVVGNGHHVTSASGYSGKVIIENSHVSGLADYDDWGIDITTTGGVSVEDSVFEATAPVRLTANGTAAIAVKNNEFRSTNFVTYFASDPSRSPVLQLSGDTSGGKTMQGNRFGGGIVRFENSDGWQVGGVAPGEGNILIGPRAVLAFSGSSNAVIQGNYDLHDYHGGWSQGFNLYFDNGSNGALAEHNVIRSSSWPVQTFGGEFRYNLVVDSGHDWWRSARDDTKIHHNIFVHTLGPDGAFNGGIMVYGGESGLDIYNNTFDGGGSVAEFAASAIVIGSGSVFASVRNNVFTNFSDSDGLVSGNGSLTYADYNALWNPLATNTSSYSAGLVTGTAGAHDVASDPRFAGTPELPYQVSAGCVWSKTYTTAQVLAHYRAMYAPASGSPLTDAGDPADGAGTDIGAVGSGAGDPDDLFGRGLQ
jgi:hypothetical protein